jgi:hypothetical protein
MSDLLIDLVALGKTASWSKHGVTVNWTGPVLNRSIVGLGGQTMLQVGPPFTVF